MPKLTFKKFLSQSVFFLEYSKGAFMSSAAKKAMSL